MTKKKAQKKDSMAKLKTKSNKKTSSDAVARATRDDSGTSITTNQGVIISDNQNTLKAFDRGPSLLEDFILREKITHFDHERIPERIVHARGSGAHGYFEVINDMSKYTKAAFLNGVGKRTPIFSRISTVQGGSSSADSVRDVRGFSIKFYTEEGNYDFVGNNFPVFIIQDAIKFPDVVHALKMEPHHAMPQGGSAHDTFWDFVSLMPETTHMVMWAMSDRGIPRSLRMIQGFGIHTFRFINKKNESNFVKFHLKPKSGVHSLCWDEAQKINGKDPDFHRRDLWESIDNGVFPEWEVFAQIFSGEKDYFKSVDLLDPTKLIPEEEAPLILMGRMVLDRNPDNFFAETEQVAFHPGHVVPGIDFSNDPLLQGRLFSYTDTQLSRLGGPNFHEIPINQAKCPVNNNQRDGIARQVIAKGPVNYEPNSIGGGCPMQNPKGFASFAEKMSGFKVRERPDSFSDHFSQATMFYNSQTAIEKNHIVDAFSFELSKVERVHIREQMVSNLQFVDISLAKKVAINLGLDYEKVASKGLPKNTTSPVSKTGVKPISKSADSLSQIKSFSVEAIEGRRVAIICLEDASQTEIETIKSKFKKKKVLCKLITLTPEKRKQVTADFLINMASSVEFDGFITLGSKLSKSQKANGLLEDFLTEGFKHLKTFLFSDSELPKKLIQNFEKDDGVVVAKSGGENKFSSALGKHRHWSREKE